MPAFPRNSRLRAELWDDAKQRSLGFFMSNDAITEATSVLRRPWYGDPLDERDT